jgi:aminoglycoside phosphotransferase
MNCLLDFLSVHRQRLELGRYGVSDTSPLLLLTPRFAASRHVIVLVLDEDSRAPTLVAKIPRLRGDAWGVEREATVLRTLEQREAGEEGSVPRVLALEDFFGYRLLLETALTGHPMNTSFVRSQPKPAIGAVTKWLSTLAASEPGTSPTESSSFERLIRRPLETFARRFEAMDPEPVLIQRTLEITDPLKADVPDVIEHGDISHPNLLWLGDGRVGVIDWELAELRGMPLHDLSFFLVYAAVARTRAGTVAERVSAFHDAFLGHSPWARAYLNAYCRQVGLESSHVPALIVATWARYTAKILPRLSDQASVESAPLSPGLKTLVRTHPHYALWRHALAHIDELARPV